MMPAVCAIAPLARSVSVPVPALAPAPSVMAPWPGPSSAVSPIGPFAAAVSSSALVVMPPVVVGVPLVTVMRLPVTAVPVTPASGEPTRVIGPALRSTTSPLASALQRGTAFNDSSSTAPAFGPVAP